MSMASGEFSLLVFIWLYLLTNNLVRGIDIPMDDKKNTTFQYSKSQTNEATKATMSLHQNNSMYNKIIAPTNGWLEKKTSTNDDDTMASHWAAMRTTTASYHGVKATFAVYGLPTVQEDQSSETSIRLINDAGGPQHKNELHAGWHVDPDMYGHSDTHFFVRWSRDGFNNTGCINLQCEGFVVDDSSVLKPGDVLQPVSTIEGQQYVINMTISKNEETGDWWVYYGLPQGDQPIGYWPSSILTTLQDCAEYIYVGGAVGFEKGVNSPPMGSGRFPDQGPYKSAFITGIQLIDQSGQLQQVQDGNFDLYHDEDDCYNIAGDVRGYLYYGGPGGCTY